MKIPLVVIIEGSFHIVAFPNTKRRSFSWLPVALGGRICFMKVHDPYGSEGVARKNFHIRSSHWSGGLKLAIPLMQQRKKSMPLRSSHIVIISSVVHFQYWGAGKVH